MRRDEGETQNTFNVVSPADGTHVATIPDLGPRAARDAAVRAWRAFSEWRVTTGFERADLLMRWFELIMERQENLANTMTREMGKPIRESRGEVAYAASFVRWYAEEARRITGEVIPSHARGKRLLALRQPVGPVYGITPWNFPAAMVTRKAAPALAAGCTFILKPAEQTPVTALLLKELWREAGGPEDTLQILTTSNPVGTTEVLLADPYIRKVTFTGSTEVGRSLYRQAANTIKKLSLELGGHAPYLVFDDADLDRAVREVMASKHRNAGQTCVGTNRLLVQRTVLEEFTKRYVEAVRGLSVGDPMLEETDVGPLVDRIGLDKVRRHVEDAVSRGALIAVGGQPMDGLYFEPTVLTGVTPDMMVMNEETFGPVSPIAAFDTEEEAVKLANDTPFGLAAYLYTNDLSRAFRITEALEYGIVGVNDGLPSTAQAPFGGVKQSGVGREGGHWGIDEYLEVKYMSLGISD